MKRPTITDIKELICGLKKYRTYFGFIPGHLMESDAKWARPQDLVVEFDTERKGVTVEYVERPGYESERRVIRFRLQENWFEAVHEQNLAIYHKNLVLSALPAARRYGVDRVMRLLYADQTKQMAKLGAYAAFAAWLGEERAVGYPLKVAAAKLREPYVKALGIEITEDG